MGNNTPWESAELVVMNTLAGSIMPSVGAVDLQAGSFS